MSDHVHRAMQLLDGLRGEIERAAAAPSSVRGDFGGAAPRVLSRIRWWERALRDALSGVDPLRCQECGREAAAALCPEHAP